MKTVIILVGGSDLFSGLRGVSAGTRQIEKAVRRHYDEVIVINYNYFLDRGRSLKRLRARLSEDLWSSITLYGYSKGGELVLELARLLAPRPINLLVTVDIANGPWSSSIDRSIPVNVQRTVNFFQQRPNWPLRSFGMPAVGTGVIENNELTDQLVDNHRINHSNIERLLVDNVISLLKNPSNTKQLLNEKSANL